MDFGLKIFVIRLYKLVISFPFWMLTIGCNLMVFCFSALFYILESAHNPQVNSLLDAVWLTFTTITTVGFGDITPITPAGRILGILLMLGGTGLFATFTALFANAMLGKEFVRLGQRVKHMAMDIHDEEYNLEKKIYTLTRSIERLEKRLASVEDMGKNTTEKKEN